MADLSPSPKFKGFVAGTSTPLVGGKLYTYLAGTTTPQATAKDQAGTANTNPIILDSNGECDLWLGNVSFKLVLKDSLDVTQWTVDNVQSATQILASIASLNVATFALLGSTAATLNQTVNILGHTTASIGGGQFIAKSGSVTNDGGMNINSATGGLYWSRINYQKISLSFFGVLTSNSDNGIYIQKAINYAQGKTIYEDVGGTYVVTTAVNYDVSGLGYSSGLKLIGAGQNKTYFDNRTGDNLISLSSGNLASDFMINALLSDFSIINPTSVANTGGIFLTGVWLSKISNVSVKDQGKFGIYMLSTIGDATDCYNVEISNCELNFNGYSGIRCYSVSGLNAGIKIINNRVVGNTLGGIECYSFVDGVISGNAIAYNSLFGVYLGRDSGGNYSKITTVENNEFDSNQGIQLKIDYCDTVSESRNYYIANNAAPIVTNFIYITTNAINVKSELLYVRVPVAYTGITAFYIEAGALYVNILNPSWSSWQNAGNTKYNNLATGAFIFDGNTALTSQSVIGLSFPSTQVPSSNANTLDDYEELTYSGSYVSSSNITGTPTFQDGTYTKIGERVFLEGQWTFTCTAAAVTTLTFTLPFNQKTNTTAAIGVAQDVNSYTVGGVSDATSGNNTQFIITFVSLAIGARVVKFSINYPTA